MAKEESSGLLCLEPFMSAFPFYQSHVVSAFEHSLSNLTERLTKLTEETEKKVKNQADLLTLRFPRMLTLHLQDKELLDMRKVIRELKSNRTYNAGKKRPDIAVGITTSYSLNSSFSRQALQVSRRSTTFQPSLHRRPGGSRTRTSSAGAPIPRATRTRTTRRDWARGGSLAPG